MTPHIVAAVRTRARAEVRAEVALMEYRYARRQWFDVRRGGYDGLLGAHLEGPYTIAARTRWSTLASLLAADAVEQTQAVAS